MATALWSVWWDPGIGKSLLVQELSAIAYARRVAVLTTFCESHTAAGDDGLVIGDVWVVRRRALLARACGADADYREHRDRYRAMATELDLAGHRQLADEMP